MIGTKLRRLRKEAGLSQQKLARLLDLSPSAVGMYEQDRRCPDWETLQKLSRQFRVPPGFWLEGEPEEQELPQLVEELRRELLRRREHIACVDGDGSRRPLTEAEVEAMCAAMLGAVEG